MVGALGLLQAGQADLARQTLDLSAAQTRVAEAAISRGVKRDFVELESGKIDHCEGAPVAALRRWLHDVTDAIGRIPVIRPANVARQDVRILEWGRAVMNKTMTHDLQREADHV
jgi:hypothetical protein